MRWEPRFFLIHDCEFKMNGSTLSHCKVLEALRPGSRDIAYKAQDTKLNPAVALNLLPEEVLRCALRMGCSNRPRSSP